MASSTIESSWRWPSEMMQGNNGLHLRNPDTFYKSSVMVKGVWIKFAALIGLDTRPGDGEPKGFASRILCQTNIVEALFPEISGPAAGLPLRIRFPDVTDIFAPLAVGYAQVIGSGDPEDEIFGQRWRQRRSSQLITQPLIIQAQTIPEKHNNFIIKIRLGIKSLYIILISVKHHHLFRFLLNRSLPVEIVHLTHYFLLQVSNWLLIPIDQSKPIQDAKRYSEGN
jgi:hypothetical protein